jgi:pilus assembly protein Flp/PilA
MRKLWRGLKRFQFDREGATAIEYGLIMALMTLALVGALASTGAATQDKWDGVSEKVGDAMDNAGS